MFYPEAGSTSVGMVPSVGGHQQRSQHKHAREAPRGATSERVSRPKQVHVPPKVNGNQLCVDGADSSRSEEIKRTTQGRRHQSPESHANKYRPDPNTWQA